MVTRILSYVSDAAIKQAPDSEYGKLSALGFVSSLLAETYFRVNAHSLSRLDLLTCISFMKLLQIIPCLKANPALSSYRTFIPTVILTTGLSFHLSFSMLGQVLREYPMMKSDRPPLIAFVACAKEIVNIASKVIQSFAVGVVAQKMFTGRTEGKIKIVVTTVLLGLSALNIYFLSNNREKNQLYSLISNSLASIRQS